MTCKAMVGYADGFHLTCDRPEGHDGSHHDPTRLLDWGPAARTEYLPSGLPLRLSDG